MTGLGYFTPFIEAPAVAPAQPSQFESGSDTSAIDHLRQGVEITRSTHRYVSTLPLIGTGNENHEIELISFGQSSEFTVDSKFEEVDRFNPVSFITNQDTLTFPVVLDNPSYEDPERMGGYIQPLTIAARDLLTSTAEFEPHDIRAHLSDGNENSFGTMNIITNIIDLHETQSFDDLYIDSADVMGNISGSISLMGFFPDKERTLSPFNETKFLSKTFISGTLTGTSSYDMITNIMSMSADTSTYIIDGFKTAGMGFTYDNMRYGTDSIAFGGLKK